jgi:hypothetical protein
MGGLYKKNGQFARFFCFKFQVSSSKFQVPGSRFQVPGSRFQVIGDRVETVHANIQKNGRLCTRFLSFRFQVSGFRCFL